MVCPAVPQGLVKEKAALSNRPLQQAVTAESEKARCFTPAFPYQRHFDGYVEMSEENAALFWRVDTPTYPVSGEEGAGPVLDSTEATAVKGLCPETTTLPEPARAASAPAMGCGPRKVILAETEQDTKPAVQSQATNTVDTDEIQEAETAIPRLHQVTTGTQTGNGDSFQRY